MRVKQLLLFDAPYHCSKTLGGHAAHVYIARTLNEHPDAGCRHGKRSWPSRPTTAYALSSPHSPTAGTGPEDVFTTFCNPVQPPIRAVDTT
eukprot:m.642864 g.642864  ORF g.642864 m.642864 type:complete len:91 (-) comp22642_c1_seq10:575-847(-)